MPEQLSSEKIFNKMKQVTVESACYYFNWEAAAQIILEKQPKKAVAGLSGDLFWTAGTIWENGHIVDDRYVYLSSLWATPILLLDDIEEIPCYKVSTTIDPKTDPKISWPPEARRIIDA